MGPINRKLKILFIHNKYLQSAGGEDATLEAETKLLRSRGHDIRELIFDNAVMKKGIIGKLKAGISSVYNINSAKTLKKAIKEFGPDIIHVHNFFFTASPSVIIEANRQKTPIVVTLHNFRLVCANSLLLRNNKVCELCVSHDFPWYGVKYKCYHDSALQSAMVGAMAAVHKWAGTWKNKVDAFIAPADFIRQKLAHSSLHVAVEKIKIKRHFINDPGAGPPQSRESYYLFIGRLSAEKGVDVLLEAWKDMNEDKLIIAGDGPEQQKLHQKYGHLKNVEFVGKKTREEVLLLMKACRALIFPSICYEGLPLTIIEAFSTGAPVIGSDMGAMKEMIRHGENGLLFTPGDPASLKKSVMRFNKYLADNDYSPYAHARNSYLQLYHPEIGYDAIIQIYHEVINKATGGIQYE